MAWRLKPGEALRSAFRRAAAEEVRKVRTALSGDADRDRAVHEARQGFKRLRAMLRLAKASLGSGYARESKRWRKAGQLLASSRDTTVILECFDRLVSERRVPLPAAKVRALRGRLARDRAEGGADSAERSLARVLTLLDEGESAIAALAWPDRRRAILRGLGRGQERLRREWNSACKDDDADALHRWRKRVKDQAAQLRLLRRLMPKDFKSRIDREKETAELLGREHDFQVLAERLRAESLTPGLAGLRDTLLQETATARQALRDAALRKGKSFSADKPKDFVRSIDAAWTQEADRRRAKTGSPGGLPAPADPATSPTK